MKGFRVALGVCAIALSGCILPLRTGYHWKAFDVGKGAYYYVSVELHPVDTDRNGWRDDLSLTILDLLKSEFRRRGHPASDALIVGLTPFEHGKVHVSVLIGQPTLRDFDVGTLFGEPDAAEKWKSWKARVPDFQGEGRL